MVRGQGHRSWVSVVSFDVYNLAYGEVPDGLDFSGSDDEGACNPPAINSPSTLHRPLTDTQGPTLHTHGGGVSRQAGRQQPRSTLTEVEDESMKDTGNNFLCF